MIIKLLRLDALSRSPIKAEGRGQKAFMLVFMPIALDVLAAITGARV
jgi:hypothetical protein